MSNEKTFSDKVFEKYLESQNIHFDYEKYLNENKKNKVQGVKTPDYSVYNKDKEILCEVKEIEGKSYISGQSFCSSMDEILKPIRTLITTASKQFKNFKEMSLPCVLVILSFDGLVNESLHNPSDVFGAMYGNPGWEIPLEIEKRKVNSYSPKVGFSNGGKMLRYKNVENQTIQESFAVQNTTISALLVLRNLENQISVLVYENYYAKNNLSKDIFCGEFDIRFGFDGKVIKKIFVGKGILNNKHFDVDKDNKFFIYFE